MILPCPNSFEGRGGPQVCSQPRKGRSGRASEEGPAHREDEIKEGIAWVI